MNKIVKVFFCLIFGFFSMVFSMEDEAAQDLIVCQPQVANFLIEFKEVVKDREVQQMFKEYLQKMLAYVYKKGFNGIEQYMFGESIKLINYMRKPEIANKINFVALNNFLKQSKWSNLFVNLIDFSKNKASILRGRSLYFIYHCIVAPIIAVSLLLIIIRFIPTTTLPEHESHIEKYIEPTNLAQCVAHRNADGCSCFDFLHCYDYRNGLNFEERIGCMLNIFKCIIHSLISNCPCDPGKDREL